MSIEQIVMNNRKRTRLIQVLIFASGLLTATIFYLIIKFMSPNFNLIQVSDKKQILKSGTKALNFSLPDLNGRKIELKDYLGRNVVLVISDPNCGACMKLYPFLYDFSRSLSSDVSVVMVSAGLIQKNKEIAARYNLQIPILTANFREFFADYKVYSMPCIYLIDRKGLIVDGKLGFLEPKKVLESFKRRINSLP